MLSWLLRSRLEESRLLWQFYWDMAEEENWIKEMENILLQVSSNPFPSSNKYRRDTSLGTYYLLTWLLGPGRAAQRLSGDRCGPHSFSCLLILLQIRCFPPLCHGEFCSHFWNTQHSYVAFFHFYLEVIAGMVILIMQADPITRYTNCLRYIHRVDRVLSFLLLASTVSTPPPLWLGEGGGAQFQRGDRHCGTLGIYILCGYIRNNVGIVLFTKSFSAKLVWKALQFSFLLPMNCKTRA